MKVTHPKKEDMFYQLHSDDSISRKDLSIEVMNHRKKDYVRLCVGSNNDHTAIALTSDQAYAVATQLYLFAKFIKTGEYEDEET